MTSALAAYVAKAKLGGELRGKTEIERLMRFQECYLDAGVPLPRAMQWAASVAYAPGMTLGEAYKNRFKVGSLIPYRIQGLTLSQYQLRVVGNTTLAGGVHAMACGLGKTITAVATAMLAVQCGFAAKTRCIIVCPLNAVPAWKRVEPDLKQVFKEVMILSMDSAHKYQSMDRAQGGVVIFDEVHLLGTDKARRTKACHALRAAFDFGLCLTGTLLHSGIEKTMSIMDLAVPGAALFCDRWAMGRHFGCLVRKQLGARTVSELVKPNSSKTGPFFAYLSRMCQIVAADSTEVVGEIGGTPQTTHTVLFGTPFRATLDMAYDLSQAYLEENKEYPHASWIRMQLLADREAIPAKLEWLMAQMVDNDLQVVVFDYFTDNLDMAQAALEDAGITYVRVDGLVTGADRAESERKFQAGEARVFLGQTHASSVSMNLQNAYLSVTLSPTQSAPDYDQALRRTARRGQTQHCHHFNLISNHTQAAAYANTAAGKDFDASAAEWQELNSVVKSITQSGGALSPDNE